MKIVIIMAGMISSGKTTYTTKLAEALGTKPFFEPVDDNPILDLYYEDMERWGMTLQLYFLNNRFRMIKKAYNDDNNVLDRSLFEDALFTKVNHMNGNINDIDYALYLDLVDNMMEEIEGMPKKAPDLMVYLDADLNHVLNNIKKRGREYEQVEEEDDIDEDLLSYYKQLISEYETWYEEYDKSPKIKIDATKYDVHKDEDWEEVYGIISDKMKELDLL